MPRFRPTLIAALAALFVPALFTPFLFASDTPVNTPTTVQAAPNTPLTNPAVPGTLNYIEGSAAIDGQPVSHNSVGSALLNAGQTLSTQNGRAEVLLTPGIFLRLGNDSAVRMISPDLTETAVALERGNVSVEVDQLFKENNVHVLLNNVPVQIVKTGYYDFNANTNEAQTFKGELAVPRNDGKWTLIKGDHQMNLSEGPTKYTVKFNVDQQQQSALYRWSSLRSDYLAQANRQLAPEYTLSYAPGWYWNPYMYQYTFLGPYAFNSPFGWGFYPLGWGPDWGWGPGWGWGPRAIYTRGPHVSMNPPHGGFNPDAYHSRFGGGGHR